MKFIIFAAIAAVVVTGCNSFSRVTDLNTSPDVIRINDVPAITAKEFGHTEVTGAANMLAKIREACRGDGHFLLRHQDKIEKYLCFPVGSGETHADL